MCSLRGLGSLEACAVIAVTIGHACLPACLPDWLLDCLARSLARSLARLTASDILSGLSAAMRCERRAPMPLHCNCVTLSRLPMYHLSTCSRPRTQRVSSFRLPPPSPAPPSSPSRFSLGSLYLAANLHPRVFSTFKLQIPSWYIK